MSWQEGSGSAVRERLAHAAESLRLCCVEALRRGSWLTPTLDDCRVDAERLLELNASGVAAEALLARAELVLRTWERLAARPGTIGRLCPSCHTDTMQAVARPGRTVPFRGVEVEIPESFIIPTCARCGAESLDPATATRLDELLWSAWSKRGG